MTVWTCPDLREVDIVVAADLVAAAAREAGIRRAR